MKFDRFANSITNCNDYSPGRGTDTTLTSQSHWYLAKRREREGRQRNVRPAHSYNYLPAGGIKRVSIRSLQLRHLLTWRRKDQGVGVPVLIPLGGRISVAFFTLDVAISEYLGQMAKAHQPEQLR